MLAATLLVGLAGCAGGGGSGGGTATSGSGGSGDSGTDGSSGGGSGDSGTGGSSGGSAGDAGSGDSGTGGSSGGGNGGGGSNGGDTPPPPVGPSGPFSVANPYALLNATKVTDVRVNRTHVFGDSYSLTHRGSADGWPTVFRKQGTTDEVATHAASGATAHGSAGTNSFARQVGRFTDNGGTIGDRDLTVLYLGQNDVKNGTSLKTSEVDFTVSADKLRRDHGATSDQRRMFVTLMHDWSRNPDPGLATRDRVVDWNEFLVDYANAHKNVVAVDMFTVFNRILDNPGEFGFENVTTADPNNANSTALFADGNHFGARGLRIIAEVYRHYLTRGWDWSNTLAAGDKTTEQLKKDIDQGVVFSRQLRMAGDPLAFSAFPVGSPPVVGAADESFERAGFTETLARDATGGGVGLNYALSRDAAFGVVVGRYGAFAGNRSGFTSSNASVDSDVVSFYLDNDWRGLNLRTSVAYGRDAHRWHAYDSLVERGEHAEFGGATWSVRQRLDYPVRGVGAWYTPWLDLTHLVQKVDGFTVANPYISDVTYSAAEASETLATLGLNAHLDPLELGHETRLTLGGGVSYTRSLRRDDYEVEIREAALPGYVQKEVIVRPEVERVGVQFGANLEVGKALNVRGGYGWLRDREAGAEHDLRLEFGYRF